jgi:hypothetical protein
VAARRSPADDLIRKSADAKQLFISAGPGTIPNSASLVSLVEATR